MLFDVSQMCGVFEGPDLCDFCIQGVCKVSMKSMYLSVN